MKMKTGKSKTRVALEETKKEKRFITAKEAAIKYGFSEGTLANFRSKKQGCKFYKVHRKVLYDPIDLDSWVTSCPVLTMDSIEVANKDFRGVV